MVRNGNVGVTGVTPVARKGHKFQHFRQVAQLDTVGLFAGAVDTCFDKAWKCWKWLWTPDLFNVEH